MERNLGITEAREKFGDLVEQVQYKGDAYIINRHGKPAAVIVPVEVYESWKRERRAFFDMIRQSQRAADLTSQEVENMAAEAVAAVRAED